MSIFTKIKEALDTPYWSLAKIFGVEKEAEKPMPFPVGAGLTEKQEKEANATLVKNYNIPKPTFLQPNEWLKRTITSKIEKEKEMMAYKKLHPERYEEIKWKLLYTSVPGYYKGKTMKQIMVENNEITEKEAELFSLPVTDPILIGAPLKAVTGKEAAKIIEKYSQKIVKKIKVPKIPVVEKISKAFNRFYDSLIDKNNPITRYAKKAGELRPGEDPNILVRRYLGNTGIANSKIFWKTTKVTPAGNLEVTGNGLSKILKPLKDKPLNDLRVLMVAERDIELASRLTKGGKPIIGTTPKESTKVINALKSEYGAKFSSLQGKANEVRDWTRKALLDPMLEVGVISRKAYEDIIKSNQFYTPFQRIMEEIETKGFISTKSLRTPLTIPIKGIKGSERALIDPLESLVANTYKLTDFVERARVTRAVVQLRNYGDDLANMIKPVAPAMRPVATVEGKAVIRPSTFAPKPNTIMAFQDGKRKFYEVPDDLYRAMSQMNTSDMGLIMKALSFPTRMLRAGATLSPEFMGRNPIRDQWTAWVYSKHGYIPGVDLVKGIFKSVTKDNIYNRWLAAGGAHSMFVSIDRTATQATLKKVLGKKEIAKYVKNPLEALRVVSEFGEKGTRVAAFAKGIKHKASDLEAMFEARDITLDFMRMGSQGKGINSIIAFWNANVQGVDKMVRAFAERPLQTTFKAVSGITLPSVLLWLHNHDNPRYQEIPQWQKDLFWIIPVGEKGPIIRIPKPFELGIIFGTVPEHILEYVKTKDPEAITSVKDSLLTYALPGFVPNALLPVIENESNYNFFLDRPVVPSSIERLPEELQATPYTSELAKTIGTLTKYSPAKIDNWLSAWTGGLGKHAISVTDELLKASGITSPPPEPEKTLADMPFVKAFIAREPIGALSESVNKFYKLWGKSEEVMMATKKFQQEGEPERAIKYLEEHPEGFLYKSLNGVGRSFSDIRKKINVVMASKELSPKQKKIILDSLNETMTLIARQTLEAIEATQ